MTAASIAIVDDDESLRNALARLFRSAAYSVETFASAVDFLSALPTRGLHCIILDLQLPGMSGVELLQHLAQFGDSPAVVVITGGDDARMKDQCMALGAKRYFRKPVDCDALLEAVREVIGGRT
jgi:FixJ family two-component response regulator